MASPVREERGPWRAGKLEIKMKSIKQAFTGWLSAWVTTWFILGAVHCASAEAPLLDSGAGAVLRKYLAMPHPSKDQMGEARMARLDCLTLLCGMPGALEAIQKALLAGATLNQREELTETIGRNIQTKEAAAVLAELLKDPDEKIRRWAVHGLRLMSRRTEANGAQRLSMVPDHPATVDGLIPALIVAAKDPSELVRMNALWALVDARDPVATQELRERLRDPSPRIRLHAACFLTEFQDASGLAELKQALRRLQTINRGKEVEHYSDAEMLLASLERITGRSFGQIPLNPWLSSSLTEIPALQESYRLLLQKWAEWWEWTPGNGK